MDDLGLVFLGTAVVVGGAGYFAARKFGVRPLYAAGAGASAIIGVGLLNRVRVKAAAAKSRACRDAFCLKSPALCHKGADGVWYTTADHCY